MPKSKVRSCSSGNLGDSAINVRIESAIRGRDSNSAYARPKTTKPARKSPDGGSTNSLSNASPAASTVASKSSAFVGNCFDRGLARDLMLSVYTEDLFATGNDVDNRAAVAGVATDDLVVVGFAVAGEGKQVNRVFDRLKLHP